MKKLLLASTSTLYSQNYLEYLLPTLNDFFKNVESLIFIPFARPGGMTHDHYTDRVQEVFDELDIEVRGLHTFDDPSKALKDAQALFTGGGNTFLLVSELYRRKLMPALRQRIFEGVPYLGTSAGTNICGPTMQNTNDMPIIYPPSFKTLGAIPFNINAHYIDPMADGTHMGETRETRIREYHSLNTVPVVGLREGSWISVDDNNIILRGDHSARIFEQNKMPFELPSGGIISFKNGMLSQKINLDQEE